MKLGNKKVIISVVLLVVTVFAIGFGIGYVNTDDGFETVATNNIQATDRSINNGENAKETEKEEYYLVGEEGGNIKLYFVEGEEAKEIKSEKISLDVLPGDDITMLSEGIKTKNMDEALAIWENFIS